MEERHKAWREIIRDMPDCATEEREGMKRIDSFHAFLNDYIKMEERGVQEFMNAANCVYSYKFHYPIPRHVHHEGWCDLHTYFSNYQHCIDHYKQCNRMEGFNDKVRIWKHYLVTPDPCSDKWSSAVGPTGIITLNPDLEILAVEGCGTSSNDYELEGTFNKMHFDFPVPSSRGDTLVDCTAYRPQNYVPLVLSHIYPEEMLSSESGENDCSDRRSWVRIRHDFENGLDSDNYSYGVARGAVIDERCGSFGWDYLVQVTDLEYYREPLKGLERQLGVLSRYEKGKLCEEDLADLCYAIRMENIGSKRSLLFDFNPEVIESLRIRLPEDW